MARPKQRKGGPKAAPVIAAVVIAAALAKRGIDPAIKPVTAMKTAILAELQLQTGGFYDRRR